MHSALLRKAQLFLSSFLTSLFLSLTFLFLCPHLIVTLIAHRQQQQKKVLILLCFLFEMVSSTSPLCLTSLSLFLQRSVYLCIIPKRGNTPLETKSTSEDNLCIYMTLCISEALILYFLLLWEFS